jgi:hypothetical protein
MGGVVVFPGLGEEVDVGMGIWALTGKFVCNNDKLMDKPKTLMSEIRLNNIIFFPV